MKHTSILFTIFQFASFSALLTADPKSAGAEPTRLAFEVAAEPAIRELSPEFCWFHPRAAAIPDAGKDGKPAVIMTLMKHLAADDHYSGLYFMRTDDLGQTWTRPAAIPELAWRKQSEDITAAVIDTTPGWHAQSGRLLVIGAKTLYTASGDYASLQTMPRSYETSYATWDPAADRWSGWKELEMPEADGKFFRAGLFLSYTRRGANNDHIARHRAPLFVAQVNPQSLQVMRSTEQVLLPERGVMQAKSSQLGSQ